MLLTFKISNGNGAHQKPCQKTYLLFPNISLPFTSLPVNCKHSPFQASSLPNDEVRRSESRSWLINLLSCLWTPHFSLPVNCKLQLGLLCTVSWDYRHCTWIKKEPGLNMLVTFKMSNGNGAHQKPCQKTYLLFPNISLPLTSLPVNCKHSPFQAPSLPNDQVRRSEWRSWLINLMCCFLTSHFPWPLFL